jgi:co-chaperonin GroES (HSP10)
MLRLPKNKVAIIPIRDPDKIGSLWVPDQAKERTDQGIVKYMGPECKYVKLGDYVAFSGYSGTLFNIQDPERPQEIVEDVIIIDEEFIVAVMDDLEDSTVPGLFFQANDGEYFRTTYEMAMHLMGRMRGEQYNFQIKTPRPELQEYDRT